VHFIIQLKIQALLQAATLFLIPWMQLVQVLLDKYLDCTPQYSSTWVSSTIGVFSLIFASGIKNKRVA